MRALRGLALSFALSTLSLIGVLLTITALGGLEEWSRWQFIGLFGAVEGAAGAANIILPNIWRLPVVQAQTPRTRVRLAPPVLLIPHWAAAARALAGATFVGLAAYHEGVGPATVLLPLLVAAFAWNITAVSLVAARFGVERPDLDVVQFVIRRPRREHELEPISIGASIVQFLVSIATIPLAKALPPSALYQPEIGPSWPLLGAALLSAVVMLGLVLLAWRGRIAWEAPPRQQREAERYA